MTSGAPAVEEPSAAPRLAAIDVYGTTRARADAILSANEAAIRKAWTTALPKDRAAEKEAVRLAILADDEIAFVELSAIIYFEAEGPLAYLTIDVVEESAAKARTPFRAAPGREPPDLAGLPAAWQAYEERFFELLAAGEIDPQRKPCPAWHCIGDYEHPELVSLIEPVRSGAESNKEALVAILFDHKDPKMRANAAFVLAHVEDGTALVGWMLQAMFDADSIVRNNAMRVLSDIADVHPEQEIPAAPLLAALDFPTTTDRNKALATIWGLLHRPHSEALAEIIRSDLQTVERLLALLELKQPNNHDFAHLILKAISGQEYGENDHAAWRRWYESLSTNR